MASPEVERPMTSPSNPVLSPHGLSPGGTRPSTSTSVLHSPGSGASRKVVTFDQCLDSYEQKHREFKVASVDNTGYLGRHKYNKHGHNSGHHRHYNYHHKHRQNSTKSVYHSTESSNDHKESIQDVLSINEKQLSSNEIGLQTHTIAQAKWNRGGGCFHRKRSHSFSEGKKIFKHINFNKAYFESTVKLHQFLSKIIIYV